MAVGVLHIDLPGAIRPDPFWRKGYALGAQVIFPGSRIVDEQRIVIRPSSIDLWRRRATGYPDDVQLLIDA